MGEASLRILFVLDYFHPHIGGVENLFKNLAQALVEQGHLVSVITLRLPRTEKFQVKDGIEIFRVNAPFYSRFLFTIWALPSVLRKARQADLIHTTLYSAALPAWIGALFARKKVVLTIHEVFGDQWVRMRGTNPVIGFLFWLFEWVALRLPFAHYICNSNFTKSRFLEIEHPRQAQTSVIYPAVDYKFWSPELHQPISRQTLKLEDDSFVYIYFGRPGVSKGVEYLLEAAALVRKDLPGSRLLMLLARHPRRQYRRVFRLVDRLALGSHVTIIKPVPREQLPGCLLAADCVVVPSLSEGFGYAAVEAATLGCRVIATGGHAVQETLNGHVTLVPPGDSRSLANELITSAISGATMSRPERRFTVASHLEKVLNVYEELLAIKPAVTAGG